MHSIYSSKVPPKLFSNYSIPLLCFGCIKCNKNQKLIHYETFNKLIIFILSFPYCSALPIRDSKTGHDTRNPIELTELTVIGNKPATHFRLACETVFDRKDLRRPGYDFSTNHSAGNYFRSITVECDPKLCAEIKALVE